ncbi:hypothetical protein H5410_032069 [Solanum commersonii]|uniref:DUF4283 domain-containing protein n=1 Tax=Solanum commersonii TaxID=4109 RepID=A0A9J5YIX7_SOLCO|nr:hypothetical protein H5410_032069 [Solanum commersonii]
MIIQEVLEFAVIEKFSYEWPELEEIRKIVPLQYEIKAEYKIGFLRDRHVLLRLTTMEDYSPYLLWLRQLESLYVDMATKNKSRPNCAKIKVEADLLRDFPKRINVGVKKASLGEIISKWINIKYDYMLKYCKTCKLQGHTEMECFVLHPELKVLNDKGENNGDSQHQNKG